MVEKDGCHNKIIFHSFTQQPWFCLECQAWCLNVSSFCFSPGAPIISLLCKILPCLYHFFLTLLLSGIYMYSKLERAFRYDCIIFYTLYCFILWSQFVLEMHQIISIQVCRHLPTGFWRQLILEPSAKLQQIFGDLGSFFFLHCQLSWDTKLA